MRNFERLDRVASGLKLVYMSLMLLVFTVIFGIVLAGALGGSPEGIGIMSIVIVVCVLISTTLSILGQIRCLKVPEKVQTSNMIYTSVVLAAVGLLINLGVSFGVLPFAPSNSLAQLATTASWICFLIFLQRLALFLDNEREVRRARFVLYGSILTWLALVVFAIGMTAASDSTVSTVFGLGMVAVMIFAIVLFVSYSNLVRGLQRDLEDRLAGRTMAA